MTEAEIIRGIARCWSYLKALHVDQSFTNPVSLSCSGEFKSLSRSSTISYEELYLAGLRLSEYNLQLADYSYFQFSGSDRNNLRYAYYPNPFLGSSSEAIGELADLRTYVDEGIIEVDEYLHRVTELRFSQHPPLLRYENSETQYEDMVHPCSHLHIGHHAENRWAVKRILTPEAFTLIVLRHFYADFWKNADLVTVGGSDVPVDDLLAAAKSASRVLPSHLFSLRAQRQFF